MNKIINNTVALSFLATIFTGIPTNVLAHSVCGLKSEVASFRTSTYLITVCPGEASYQMILMFPDGTGYQKIPTQRQGNRFNGSDGKHNYIIDRQTFIIGTDGEPPIRQAVTRARFSP